ncbi:helix-turn-helix domain-containing protein [Actinoplanes sp. CA-252034]|uniref:helix-turn-helix domain-containing protein n=1 Tax=Actinoplanes sp. CA-252034 TaxID=3239906 RepID=UPI003D99CD1B
MAGGVEASLSAVGHEADIRGRLIRALAWMRRRRGLTQGQIAGRMSTTQSAISELENGGTDPRLSTLQRYARVLGCSLDLMLREGVTRHFTSWEERSLPYKANSRTKVLKADASEWGYAGDALVVTRAGVPIQIPPPGDDEMSVASAGDDGFVRALDEAVNPA